MLMFIFPFLPVSKPARYLHTWQFVTDWVLDLTSPKRHPIQAHFVGWTYGSGIFIPNRYEERIVYLRIGHVSGGMNEPEVLRGAFLRP
jgi:hypothetical protein